MHPYATDSSERKSIPFYIAGLSILAAWIFYKILEAWKIILPWWSEAPSGIGFYGLFYAIFDKVLWKTPILRTIRVIKVPDLNGVWKGYVASSFDEHSTKHEATVTIQQTWTKVSIIFETKYSRSYSLIAGILTNDPAGMVLDYEFMNEPKAEAKETMHAHRGTARLILKGESLEGEYYSGRDRQNYGSLHLQKLR